MPPVAPPQHVHGTCLQVVQQRRQVVGHLLVGEPVGAVAGLPLIAAVHRDHLVSLAKVIDLGTQVGDAAAVEVHDQEGISSAIHLVIERDAVVREGTAGFGIGTIPDRGGRGHTERLNGRPPLIAGKA